MNIRNLALTAPFVLLAACQRAEPVAPEQEPPASPVMAASATARIPGRYVVVLKNDARDVSGLARSLAAANGGDVGYIYEAALKGFSVTLRSAQAAEAIARNPDVAFVEEDQVMTASATQSGATWGLDRLDQRDLPLSTSYSYTATGSGVRAYIVDSGILTSHTEFGGRASTGYDAITPTSPKADCNGHGTHVAGTIGGGSYGVAKDVRLIAVRVLDCLGSGSVTGVIAGVNWVAANAVKPAVANMSLGGGASSSLDYAVAGAIGKGVAFVVAAGNSNADACLYSPARAAAAITVGATTNTDARASYSNYGTCLDIFAPGSSITSAWYTSTTATNTISGTSMASPHVAGVAALFLQRKPTSSPQVVRDSLAANATAGKVTLAGTGSANRLLYSNY